MGDKYSNKDKKKKTKKDLRAEHHEKLMSDKSGKVVAINTQVGSKTSDKKAA